MSTVATAPRFTRAQAKVLAHKHFGLVGETADLPSERDQNFLLTTREGRKFVLKVANPAEERAVLVLQNEALLHLGRREGPPLGPRLYLDQKGRPVAEERDEEGNVFALRLVSYLEGRPFAESRPHSPDLLGGLGRFIGRLTSALAGFDHPAAKRDFYWDLTKGPEVVRRRREFIGEAERRALVDKLLAMVERTIRSGMADLPRSVIHNDANDYNVIVSPPDRRPEAFGERRIAGIIDFGDMVHSVTLGDLAVACAYAMLSQDNPLAAAAAVAAGFHAEHPLGGLEIELLYPLIALRLIMSVAICAHQSSLRPDNVYLRISNEAIWGLLEKLENVSPRLAEAVFRRRCGFPALPTTARAVAWLKAKAGEFAPVLGRPLAEAGTAVLDLSVDSLLIDSPPAVEDTASFSGLLFGEMARRKADFGIGRYGEARLMYTSDAFRPAGRPLGEGRTVHLGIDIFAPPGTPVHAPLDGVLRSARNNAVRQDYGPTIILEHRAEDVEGPFVFFTLYGHLSAVSLEGIEVGRECKKGERIASVGTYPENGDWPPHLHFQVILDMLDEEGNFPGVARASEFEVWGDICPDPHLILGMPTEALADQALEPGEIMDLRRSHLGRSLIVSYAKPLKIVRGFMGYLYDQTGRRYLDAVNNVPHVGHSHPRVVEAVRRQVAVLNTNTRYLHDNLVRYARRLVSLMPEPLRVAFIVNSGSEANDLALRLARNFTRQRDMVVLAGGYHGNLSSLIEVSSYKFDGPGGGGRPPHTHVAVMPDLYRGPFRAGDPEAGAKYALEVKAAADRAKSEGRGIAGFICEPILSCGGQIVLPDHFLPEAYRHIREAGGVCIADEVQVGFGRAGTHFWGFETQGVVPEIVTLGKPIGNGFPLAAVVTTPAIAAAFATGMEYFNTFGGNPVSCAAGMAVLDVVEGEGLQARALRVGERLKNGLRGLMKAHPLIGDVRGLGLFLGLELVRDRETREPAGPEANYVANRMREEGVLIGTDGPFRNVLKLKPPLCFGEADADLLVETLSRILSEI
ncbi:MAG: aminotransferase class III-fold pyridoxal phosphate-dependent enzyme [Candidatus Aminicenantes bacterium]|nr:aminotransferase class III-fold pyridoxal phosphate-dependent enzyme [Candidatus Aminicenantes bacterium]